MTASVVMRLCSFHIQEPTPRPSQEGNLFESEQQFPSWEG